MRSLGAVLVTLGLGATASAHRLDEYLQATIIGLAKDRVHVSMLLMPGVAVFPRVIPMINTNGDGTISAAEQRRYATKVLGDLSFSVDGKILKPQLATFTFPKVEEMKKGLGTIRLTFDAMVPAGSGSRRLVFENRHQPQIGAYLANCLMPDDPLLRVTDQKRNYTQSRYELSYQQRLRREG